MPGVDDFEYSADLGMQRIDPDTMEPGKLISKTPTILHSTLKRATDCIAHIHGTFYIPEDSLREIKFDLRTMCAREEFDSKRSVAVRRRFIEFFLEDRLPISRIATIDEVEKTLKLCLEFSDVAVISHSFRLKVIEAFIMTGGKIKEDPSLIRNYIHEDRKTFEFGRGFEVDRNKILLALEHSAGLPRNPKHRE